MRGFLRIAALAVWIVVAPGVLRAGVLQSAAAEGSNFQENYLLGDWAGFRTTLWEHGIKPKFLLVTCILILIVEMASKPFSDFYAGQRSFRLK